MRYDDAVVTLYQAPVDQFIAERKRLASELKAAGDKRGAALLAKRTRPPISAWVVDQLWWQHRAAFDALFATASRLRDGELDAMAAHRDAMARLRSHAVTILSAAEHGATEATLRRITQTLAALAAAGTWDPDPPGALSADRDPPGFEALGVTADAIAPAAHAPAAHAPVAHAPAAHATPAAHAAHGAHRARHEPAPATGDAQAAIRADEHARLRREAAEAERRRDRETAAARAEAAATLRRAEAERARAAAERQRLEAALRTAHGDIESREREVVKLERDLAIARTMVVQARAVVDDLEQRLGQLDN